MISKKHQENKDEPVTIRVKIGLVKEVACSWWIGRWLSSNKLLAFPRYLHFKVTLHFRGIGIENTQAVIE